MAFLSGTQLVRQEHRLLGLMLVSLLAAVAFNRDIDLSRSLFISHFGFFLLWQPLVKRESRFSLSSMAMLGVFIGLFVIALNKWLIPFWMLMLLSLMTGRIFSRGMSRAAYALAVIILFLQLILITTPALFELRSFSSHTAVMLELALIAIALPLLFIPSSAESSTHVDFIRGFLVVLLTLFLCMGSALASYVNSMPYIQSLAIAIIIAAAFLFATSVLWTPRGGFTGLAQLWERYLLNIGGPFEQWISQLSSLEANANLKPEYFLQTSIRYLVQRYWVKGIHYRIDRSEHLEGETSRHSVSIDDKQVAMTLYAYSPIGPALVLHTRLLLNVLAFYYNAKLQEQQLAKQAHLRAIYETGSKLTHDVKNILQSTQTLTQVISHDDGRIEESHAILKRQLPLLTRRLQTTLDKLSAPGRDSPVSECLEQWWQELQARYNGRSIDFSGHIHRDVMIPLDMFNTVAENLLENARNKRIEQPEIRIEATLESGDDGPVLTIRDTGTAIDADTASQLFSEVIASENGFGIGLYQSYQQAKRAGFELSLASNRAGEVGFQLAKAA